MKLYAINLVRLKKIAHTFKDTNVRVSCTLSILTIDVRYDCSLDPKTSNPFVQLNKHKHKS